MAARLLPCGSAALRFLPSYLSRQHERTVADVYIFSRPRPTLSHVCHFKAGGGKSTKKDAKSKKGKAADKKAVGKKKGSIVTKYEVFEGALMGSVTVGKGASL